MVEVVEGGEAVFGDEEFVRALAEGSGGAEFPEKLAGFVGGLEEGDEVEAVGFLGGDLASGEVDEGGGEVEADDGLVAGGGGEGVGVSDEEGDTDAALQDASFLATVGGVHRMVGRAGTAVVAEEDDYGVVEEILAFEVIEEFADVDIKAVNHGGVGFAALLRDEVVEFEVFFRGLHGGVGGVVAEEEEEWLIGVAVDKAVSGVAEVVGEIGDGFGVFDVGFEGAFEVVVTAGDEAVELVESVVEGVELGFVALMPFADESGSVAEGLEAFGEGGFG